MSEKVKSILSYIFGWIGGLIVLFAIKDNERNTKLHAAQSVVISLGYMIISFVYSKIPIYIPFFNTELWGIYLALIIIGIIKANKEEDAELPVVGGIANTIFGKKIDE